MSSRMHQKGDGKRKTRVEKGMVSIAVLRSGLVEEVDEMCELLKIRVKCTKHHQQGQMKF